MTKQGGLKGCTPEYTILAAEKVFAELTLELAAARKCIAELAQ